MWRGLREGAAGLEECRMRSRWEEEEEEEAREEAGESREGWHEGNERERASTTEKDL